MHGSQERFQAGEEVVVAEAFLNHVCGQLYVVGGFLCGVVRGLELG